MGMEETQTEKVERMIIEEITVPLIKTRNYFQCEGINFEEDEVLILLCIKPDGLFQVRYEIASLLKLLIVSRYM